MAETKNPSLAELNEAIAREHGIDPEALKDYKLPERAVDPEAHRAVEAAIHRPALVEALRRPNPLAQEYGIPNDGLAVTSGPPDGYRGQPREPQKVTPLSAKSPSCFSWTPRQMLLEFVAAIDRGEELPKGMVIVYSVENADQSISVHSWRAQLNWTEEYTFLEVSQQKCIDEKRR